MSKRKLLVADDSVTIQKVVNLTFADEGFEVISVGDGNSAMDKVREESPDLIMADVNMPGLNGYEICEKIKKGDGFGSIPVILLVGSFEPFDEAEAERVGADDHLTKPFQSISQLVESVTMLISKKGPSEDLVSTQELPIDRVEADDSGDTDEAADLTEFDSDGLNDEAIHTEQVGDEPGNAVSESETIDEVEVAKEFESEPLASEGQEGFEIVSTPEVTSAGSEFQVDGEFDQDLSSSSATDTKDYGTDQERSKYENGDGVSTSADQTAFNLDESNPLELSFIDPAVWDAEEEGILDDDGDEFEATTAPLDSSDELTEAVSREAIDVIATRVVEMMPDEIVKEVARGVVSEKAESIIKQIVEEKMKD